MRKPLLALLVLLALLCGMALAEEAGQAGNTVYGLKNIGAEISIPSDWQALVRETSADEDYLALGLDPTATRASFDAGSIALWALPSGTNETVTLAAEAFEDADYSGLGVVQLHLMLGLWRQRLMIAGGTAERWRVYDSSDSRWLCMRYLMDGLYVLQYETVDHNTKFDIRLVSPEAIDETREILMDSLVYHCKVKAE